MTLTFTTATCTITRVANTKNIVTKSIVPHLHLYDIYIYICVCSKYVQDTITTRFTELIGIIRSVFKPQRALYITPGKKVSVILHFT